tara:strand:- start:4410 stop:5015 length:606 start_codon:yes stop_codon:yes gene_type:complete
MGILLVLALTGIILGSVALTKKCDTAYKEGLLVGSSSSEFRSCKGTVVPIGTILPFYAMKEDKTFDDTRIPDGWVICNGTDVGGITVPDLRNKYLMGWNENSFISNVNGGKSFDLKILSENLPSHNHSYSYQEYSGNHNFQQPGGTGSIVPDYNTKSVPTENTGENKSIPIPIGEYINNFPIVYIMYVGTENESPCSDKMV